MDSPTTLAQRIDALLPQTQCTRCGYPACCDYANAIATDAADINQCPPGGARGIDLLAQLLGRQVKPLNPNNGIEKPRDRRMIEPCQRSLLAREAVQPRGRSRHRENR